MLKLCICPWIICVVLLLHFGCLIFKLRGRARGPTCSANVGPYREWDNTYTGPDSCIHTETTCTAFPPHRLALLNVWWEDAHFTHSSDHACARLYSSVSLIWVRNGKEDTSFNHKTKQSFLCGLFFWFCSSSVSTISCCLQWLLVLIHSGSCASCILAVQDLS